MRTSTGEHFSHHSVHLNVEFKLQEVFKHFFATRYLIPVLANSSFPLALKKKKKKKRQLDGSWYVHSACILLESRGWTLKMVSLVSHLDGWNFTYLKKKGTDIFTAGIQSYWVMLRFKEAGEAEMNDLGRYLFGPATYPLQGKNFFSIKNFLLSFREIKNKIVKIPVPANPLHYKSKEKEVQKF